MDHEPPMVQDKAGLLEQITRYRTALETALEPLSDDQMTASPGGGWSIKDQLVHITAWEQSAVALLQRRPRYEGLGVEADTYLNGDVDTINEQIYTQNRDRPLADVLAAFRSSHQQLLEVLDDLTDEDLHRPYADYLPDDLIANRDVPAGGWVAGNTFGHYAEHLELIKSLAGQGSSG